MTQELTEFERTMIDFHNHKGFGGDSGNDAMDCLKFYSQKLITIAEKQIVPKLRMEWGKNQDECVKEAYKQGEKDGIAIGKAEAQKDLPRWKKMHNGAMGSGDEWNKPYLIRSSAGHYYMSTCVGPDNTYLELSDLEKLPKEDE